MTLLDKTLIQQQLLRRGFPEPYSLSVFATIDSTNQYLKTLPRTLAIDVCCAEMQTGGRGRLNREWYSPPADNIYCSMRRYIDNPAISGLSALSLVTGIAIMQTLTTWQISADIAIKWPNDLLWHDKKLGGILIESYPDPSGALAIIIGVGLNVNVQPDDPRWHANLNRPWCSLFEITGHPLDRNQLLADLMFQLDNAIRQFLSAGLPPFQSLWDCWDYLRGKTVTLIQSDKKITGIAAGITPTGQLIVIDDLQYIHKVSSGEATIGAL